MDTETNAVSRRTALGAVGATAAGAALLAGGGSAFAAPAVSTTAAGEPAAETTGGPVRLLLNGAPATTGSHGFPDEVDTVVLDNGLVRFTFGRDDLNGVYSGYTGVSVAAVSVVVDGVELGHHLNGSKPVDDGRAPSFYVDDRGGKTRLMCTEVRVLRVGPDLVEVAFVDSTSTPLHHEHHLIMRRGRRGVYGFDVMTAAEATTISEVRLVSRWDRTVFDHSFNWERGSGQQPTYDYLNTQVKLQDETWRVDGVNNKDLAAPDSNSGNLPPGTAYSKYEWSLYHHENPMFGHYGHGFGVWFTPLGGVTGDTLCAFYGVGPTHQDLAIHQDATILNYFGANHYDLPGYDLPAGYTRLYGPWYTFFTTADENDPGTLISDAAATARAEIRENRAAADWIDHPLYPGAAQRTTVTGRLALKDGRPAGGFWVLLSTQDADDVYTIHEPTYFVRTGADGSFTLPGIPPAWKPGTSDPGTYTLYVFAADGSVTEQYKRTGITPAGRAHDLGTLTWAPASTGTFLWQIGRSDRTGGEYALATHPVERDHPRDYDKPSRIPGDLTFTVGESWEPADWYYAQTSPGTWTVRFSLDRVPAGTAALTVSSSMQAGSAPTVAVNGSTDGITGSLSDSDGHDGNGLGGTIGRQADRSGRRRVNVLTFPASMLREGANTLEFTRGASIPAGDGLGWDTLLLEVAPADPAAAPAAARLKAEVVGLAGSRDAVTWTVRLRNTGRGTAHDVRLTGVRRQARWGGGEPLAVADRDPALFPVPVTATLAPGASTTFRVTAAPPREPTADPRSVVLALSADGGRATTTASARTATWPWAAKN
ncbi:polysaccharide lyase family protein [Streptomyces sp. TS71-3]|uniref:polysaccharide lyase family protein n=1 Tax=Streptomyces sp. TS71-3 TaxID=2733862 RepID=UPI001B253E5F|nr:polysaccharide lyase family protein [Streptomyces sp. TS71-3]GHJ41553.1 hypothetical protein Sm713_71620 [Streptomyces sp. TS71-3]